MKLKMLCSPVQLGFAVLDGLGVDIVADMEEFVPTLKGFAQV
jgi:hypothetical protein